MDVKPVIDQLHRVLAVVTPLPPQVASLGEALGCVLAQDVTGVFPLPGFDNSAMDGYAVRAADVALASPHTPVSLPVAGDIAAGDTRRHRIVPGTTMRIMTGAPMPEGADAVVPVELTDGGTAMVAIQASASVGAHLRRAGEDIRAGDVVLRAGTRIGPRQLALAASAGAGRMLVYPVPRVAVVSTGDELVQPGSVPEFGQVIDSNGPMLRAALVEQGFHADRVVGVGDTPADVLESLRGLVEPGHPPESRVDAVVTTGGVSMGAYDAVKEALSTLGTVNFTQVAMQPGKPQGFGVIGEREVPVFTLPGNPVSALVSLEVFVAPALRVMAGRPAFEVAMQPAVAAHDFGSPAGKVQFARVVVDRRAETGGEVQSGTRGEIDSGTRGEVQSGTRGEIDSGTRGEIGSGAESRARGGTGDPTHPWRDPIRRPPAVRLAGVGQGSHMLGGLAEADGLAVIPMAVTTVRAGDALTCLPLPGGWWG